MRERLAAVNLDVLAETRRVDVGRLGIPVYLSVCGWIDGGGQALDCSGEAPFYAGWRKLTWRDTDSVCYVFGRVDQADIARLHVGIMYPS